VEKPKRPDSGPAASIDTSDAVLNELLKRQQMLLQNTFDDSLSGLTSEINKTYSCEDMDMNDENVNVSNTSESSLNCHKSATSAVESDLIKFSVTNISETGNKRIKCNFTSVSKHDSAGIPNEAGNPGKLINKIQYGYEEVSSRELPVLILNNNPEKSAMERELSEETCSSNIPVCVKK